MPHMMMCSLDGTVVQITSTDPGTLADWLMEWLPKLCPGTPALPTVRLEIRQWATRFLPDGSAELDWPPRSDVGNGEHWTPAEIERIAATLRVIEADREAGR